MRREWFRLSERTEAVIELLRDPYGLEAWRNIGASLGWTTTIAKGKRPSLKRGYLKPFPEVQKILTPEEKRRAERQAWWANRPETKPNDKNEAAAQAMMVMDELLTLEKKLWQASRECTNAPTCEPTQ